MTPVGMLEKTLIIPRPQRHQNIIGHIQNSIEKALEPGALPVRFAITHMDQTNYHCELGTINGLSHTNDQKPDSIFRYAQRHFERTNEFNAVLIVPTGIGAEIGGHAGDATPVARVLGENCDQLITHPNVVNASDINEMPHNTQYVEGSTITRLIMGTVALQCVRSNRVLMVIDNHPIKMFANDTVNAISAAHATYGLDCPKVIQLNPPLNMKTVFMDSGRAAGEITGLERIRAIIAENQGTFDALGIASVIDVEDEYHEQYFHSDGKMINPWGGVEAMLTHALSLLHHIPTAHSPMLENHNTANFDLGVVEPRLAAEAISLTFIQCMLKGLHRSPRIITIPEIIREPGLLSAADVSCLIIPDKCVGLPTLAAIQQGIPVIAVRENNNLMRNDLTELPWTPGQLHIVENYWEAVGVMSALRSGVSPKSLRRPLAATQVELKNMDL